MKKVLSVIITAAIVLSALVVLASCGGGTIVGKWVATIDYDKFADEGNDGGLSQLGIDLSGKSVDLVLELKEDGTYVASVDMANLIDAMREPMKNMIESMISFTGQSLDDYLAEQGFSSFDEYLNSTLSGEDSKTEGKYTFENGELKLDDSAAKAELSGNTLKITEIITEGEEGYSVPQELLPITFNRK